VFFFFFHLKLGLLLVNNHPKLFGQIYTTGRKRKENKRKESRKERKGKE